MSLDRLSHLSGLWFSSTVKCRAVLGGCFSKHSPLKLCAERVGYKMKTSGFQAQRVWDRPHGLSLGHAGFTPSRLAVVVCVGVTVTGLRTFHITQCASVSEKRISVPGTAASSGTRVHRCIKWEAPAEIRSLFPPSHPVGTSRNKASDGVISPHKCHLALIQAHSQTSTVGPSEWSESLSWPPRHYCALLLAPAGSPNQQPQSPSTQTAVTDCRRLGQCALQLWRLHGWKACLRCHPSAWDTGQGQIPPVVRNPLPL